MGLVGAGLAASMPNDNVARNKSVEYAGRMAETLATPGDRPKTTRRTPTPQPGKRKPAAAGSATKGRSTRKTPWLAAQRSEFLIEAVGGVRALARVLEVAPSQPSRWRTGEDIPSPEIASRLLDLDHVYALAVQAWSLSTTRTWMTSENAFLGGAEPIVVLRQRGSAEVVKALRATISGAYA